MKKQREKERTRFQQDLDEKNRSWARDRIRSVIAYMLDCNQDCRVYDIKVIDEIECGACHLKKKGFDFLIYESSRSGKNILYKHRRLCDDCWTIRVRDLVTLLLGGKEKEIPLDWRPKNLLPEDMNAL